MQKEGKYWKERQGEYRIKQEKKDKKVYGKLEEEAEEEERERQEYTDEENEE